MTFEIIDAATRKPVAEDTVSKKAKDAGLLDVDSFVVKTNGDVLLLDTAGNYAVCDSERFVPRRTGKYPDLEYFEKLVLDNIQKKYPKIFEGYVVSDIEFDIFQQTWPSTAGGFEEPGMVAGAALTREYTTVAYLLIYYGESINTLIKSEFYGVFFGNRLAYILDNANEVFLEDLKNRKIKSKYDAEKAYVSGCDTRETKHIPGKPGDTNIKRIVGLPHNETVYTCTNAGGCEYAFIEDANGFEIGSTQLGENPMYPGKTSEDILNRLIVWRLMGQEEETA